MRVGVRGEGGGRGKGWGRGKGEAVEVVLRCHTAVLAIGPARVSVRDRVRASGHVPVLAIRSDDVLVDDSAGGDLLDDSAGGDLLLLDGHILLLFLHL